MQGPEQMSVDACDVLSWCNGTVQPAVHIIGDTAASQYVHATTSVISMLHLGGYTYCTNHVPIIS